MKLSLYSNTISIIFFHMPSISELEDGFNNNYSIQFIKIYIYIYIRVVLDLLKTLWRKKMAAHASILAWKMPWAEDMVDYMSKSGT